MYITVRKGPLPTTDTATLLLLVSQYVAPGVISIVSPNNGQYSTRVTITGTGLLARGQNIVSVKLGTVLADVVLSNNTDVVVVLRAALPGVGLDFC